MDRTEPGEGAVVRRSWGSVYALCQVGGWGGWALLYGLLSAAYVPHTMRVLLHLAFSYGLSAGYGMVLTHVLSLRLRGGWMKLAWGPLLLRVVPAVVLEALVATGALILINDRLLNIMGGRVDTPASVLFFVINFTVTFGIWMIVYALLYQARERRAAEQVRGAMELAMRKAQYRSLAAQVQPHFLFNALNTIRALIYEDPAEADRAVTRLAALLRAGLRDGDRHEHRLADELRIVEDYLGLEKLRFEERLRVTFCVEEAALTAVLPPMSLQHLVENALKHGIAPLPQGGEVEIRADRHGAVLALVVRNSFTSVAAAQGKGPAAQGSTGSGLNNMRERLFLLYGGEAGLVLEREEGFMRARMHLPFAEEAMLAGAAD